MKLFIFLFFTFFIVSCDSNNKLGKQKGKIIVKQKNPRKDTDLVAKDFKKLNNAPLSNRELVKKGKRATVLIKTKDRRNREIFATAFCIDKSGLFITNYHVVEHGISNIQLIMHPGKRTQRIITAKLIRKDKKSDLALLQATNKGVFSSFELGLSKDLYETMEVMAFGFPFGKALAIRRGKYPAISVNLGRISSLREGNDDIDRVQLDVMLNPGNSGGPVINKQGQVVGVVAFGVYGSGVNFAIPVNRLKRFLIKPIVQFLPPVITQKNMHSPIKFAIKVIPFLQQKISHSVELRLNPGKNDQRSYAFKCYGGVYQKMITPIPSKGSEKLNIEATFPRGFVKGIVDDGRIKVDTSYFKISQIESITLKTKYKIYMVDGKHYFPSNISGLDLIRVQLGGEVIQDLSKALKIKFERSRSRNQITYLLTVKENEKIVAKKEGSIWIEGAKMVGVWDVKKDYNWNNPNGVWSYGWRKSLNSSFNLYREKFLLKGGSRKVLSCKDSGNDKVPCVSKTQGGVLAEKFAMHPGPKGQLSVTRWTSPSAGMVTLVGKFGKGDSGGVDVYVLKNNKELFSTYNTRIDTPFSLKTIIKVKDIIKFIVGRGNDRHYYDSTPLDVVITAK